MHHHAEIIMPPTDDVELTAKQIMAPFDKNGKEEDRSNNHAFWNRYKIGGQWGGHKMLVAIGDDKIEEFRIALREAHITVSGLTMGKETLQPSEQIPVVNAMWNAMFPEAPVKVCPLFDNYKDSFGDTLPVRDLPDGLTAEVVIIAGPDWKGEAMTASTLLFKKMWNGVNYQDSTWDGQIATALAMHVDRLKRYNEEYRVKRSVSDDWLVVTVDYHS